LGCLLAWPLVLAPLFLGCFLFCKVWQGFIIIIITFWTSILLAPQILSHMVSPKFNSLVSNVKRKVSELGVHLLLFCDWGASRCFYQEKPNVLKKIGDEPIDVSP
jgi:hypothetical protein